jgi:cell division protein FtsB
MNQKKGNRLNKGKKKRQDMYGVLLTGLITWVLIALLLFFGVRWLVKAGLAQREEVVENPPVVPEAPVQPTPPVIEDDVIDYAKLAAGDELYVGVVSTLVTMGFPDFTDIASVDEENIISFGVWEVLKSSRYSKGMSYADDRVYIDAAYVEQAAREELGYTGAITHRTVSLYGEFKYDMLSNRYSAPSYGIAYGTLPVVRTCTVQDGTVTLVVDCYPMSEEQEESEVKTDPSGTLKFTLDVSGDVPIVESMQTVS